SERRATPPRAHFRPQPALGGETPKLCLARASHNDHAVKPILSAGFIKKRYIQQNASLGFAGFFHPLPPPGLDDWVQDGFQGLAPLLAGEDNGPQLGSIR